MLKRIFEPVRIALETALLVSILLVALVICMALDALRGGN
jgi:hypothetical protein